MGQEETLNRVDITSSGVQLELLPIHTEDLHVLRSRDQVAVFCRGFCLFTFDLSDRFSRNYCLIQLHLAGQVKLKDLSRLFGLSYQHCSNMLARYKSEGVEGLIEQTVKRFENRRIIDDEIGRVISDLRGSGTSYREISQVIRFRYKKRLKPQSIRAWVYRWNRDDDKAGEFEQLELYGDDGVSSTAQSAGEWRWNGYAGSMILYGMIEWSGFLHPFEEFLTEDEEKKKSSWGVRRLILTLFFLHALRCKSIEQSKHLVGADFREIVGGSFLRLQWLRYGVDELVNHSGFDRAIDAYYRDLLNLTDHGDGLFYTDAHFSSYYGKRRIPKGYDPRRQMGFRGRNTVYLHNSQGENIYLFESPTNTSLSNDIKQLIGDVERLGMELKGKTLIFDRGGYSRSCFEYLRLKKMYFVTYLKNRKKERQVEEREFARYVIETEDGGEEVYRIFEKEKRETHYGGIRIIVFLADDGRQIPVLTNNPYLKKERTVYLLQRRWREENCFKYMIEHFGIDLLTTYKTDQAPDKVVKRVNPERREVDRLIQQKRREMERLQNELAKQLTESGHQSNETINEFLSSQKELGFAIKNIQVDIDYLTRKKSSLSTKVEVNLRDECIIIAQKRRLLINAIKAMNYNAEKWFQLLFKDYHAKLDETLSLIRSLWQQPGRIRYGPRHVEVELDPLDMGSMRASLAKVLEVLRERNHLRLPDGRRIQIYQRQ